MKKSIAVLGLGRYGQFLADALCRQGADVLVADDDEEIIQRFAPMVSCAVKADLNEPGAIRNLGLGFIAELMDS